MSAKNQKLDILIREVTELRDLEKERLEKELEFLKSVQRERGLRSIQMITRDECIGFAERGIVGFLET